MKVNFSRESFTPGTAPYEVRCSCGCGLIITKGQAVFTRFNKRAGGLTRIIDLEDHYRSWLDKVTHAYALKIARHDSEFRKYLNGEL